MRAEFGALCFSSRCSRLGLGLKRERILVRFSIERQSEQFIEGAAQAVLVARIDFEQIRVADDLVQAGGTLERAQLLEHALIIAGTPDALHHQLLAAGRQAIHLHGRIHDGEKQRGGHDRESDQHQPAQ